MAARDFLVDIASALKDVGCARARVVFKGSEIASLEVEFATAAGAPAGFTDAEGKPVNLDEGAGALTRDPDEDEAPPALETSDAALERANFRPKPNGKAG